MSGINSGYTCMTIIYTAYSSRRQNTALNTRDKKNRQTDRQTDRHTSTTTDTSTYYTVSVTTREITTIA